MDRITRILPYAALVAAAALVVVLGQQKRTLIGRYDDLQQRYYRALREPLPNSFLPSFQTATLEGEPVTIGQLPQAGRQVLFVYTTTCPYCKASLPAWKRIAGVVDTMTAPSAQVYGVSLDSADITRRYAAAHQLPYHTVRFPDQRLVSMYRAGAVPLTLVLDEQGRTVYARVGELSAPAAVDSVIAAVKRKPAPAPRPAAPPAPNTTPAA
ncbi:TlpA disulfide reductase family protein [Longimicrobium sp.]|uniref:peroxiredoxin family protein n=1 Tax=Longimicrobium sp. TaxID=2029185 RepID=UPI002B73DB94|nr:TlpA disulfide reductase family protein [Longimicrobium sp.]HSU15462.1 TlpA disulfide reductase family protein [Longimicrobium sp.]